MPYLRNEPIATDDLDISQPKLQGNTNASDDSFGIDHYQFSDGTSNNGKHKSVTSISSGAHAIPIANEPKIYGMQDSAPVGVVQYSRYFDSGLGGPAVPTPLTHLQSSAAAITLAVNGTTNVLDFTGLARAFCVLYAMDTTTVATTKSCSFIIWNGANITINTMSTGINQLVIQSAGNILQLRNGSVNPLNDVYWTLQMDRLQ